LQKSSLIILVLFILAISANGQSGNVQLTVEVTGLEVIDGSSVMIAVYNSEDTYFDSEQIYASAEIAVDDEEVSYVFKDFPVGDYAVTIYHDEDGDGEMDRKWYGPPKEGYAFSNNYTSGMRPARWDDAVFSLEKDQTISIKMVY
jgi:uncharacterized protein (DUF2141 family)